MEEEQKVEEQPEVSEEVKEEESAAEEEATEEAPAEEAAEEEAPAEACECCSPEATKSAEDMVRDLVNMVNVMKEEEVEGVTTRVQPEAADELVAKLEELAKKVSEICG